MFYLSQIRFDNSRPITWRPTRLSAKCICIMQRSRVAVDIYNNYNVCLIPLKGVQVKTFLAEYKTICRSADSFE